MARVDLKAIGATGLHRMGGVIREEYLQELRGTRGRSVYTEMSEQDAVLGGVLFAIEMMIRGVEWGISEASDDPTDIENAEFVESCIGDMETPFKEELTEILTMLPYGWSLLEILYKLRQGESDDPTRNSAYDDGYFGWREWSIRSQDSLVRWEFDEEGRAVAMVQSCEPDFRERTIPLEKALLFRTTIRKDNPEGASVLRRCYREWYFKRHLESIEGIGAERDLAGLPVMYLPAEMLREDASAEDRAVVEYCREIVTQIRNDEQAGLVLPGDVDPVTGKPIMRLELLSTGGQRQFDTDKIIQRKEKRMAGALLADFILLGQDKVGSYALAQPVTASVLTPTGFAPMGELKIGDALVDPLGGESRVKAIHDHGLRQVYEVHFGDGRVVETSAEHRWAVTTPYWKRQGVPQRPRQPWAVTAPLPYAPLSWFGVLTTEQIGERLGSPGVSATFEVPPVMPVEYAPRSEPLPVDPYLLGQIIGNGWTGSASGHEAVVLTTPDQEVIDAAYALVGETVRVKAKPGSRAVNVVLSTGYGRHGNVVTTAMRELDLRGRLAHQKSIPPQYLYATVAERIGLLQGLMDSDGTCCHGQNVFTTVSAQLADDMEQLVRSLGATSVYRRTRPATNENCHVVHVVDFDLNRGIVPFRLPRKVAKYRPKEKTQGNKITRIVATDRYAEMRCISVTAPSSLYITDGFVPTHNSSDKTEMFSFALGAWMDGICSVVDPAIKRLLKVNGMRWVKAPPRLRHGDVESVDPKAWSEFLAGVASAGGPLTPEMFAHVYRKVGLPVPEEGLG